MKKAEEILIRKLLKDLYLGNTKETIKYLNGKLPKKKSTYTKKKESRNDLINSYRKDLIKNITPSEKIVFSLLKREGIEFKFQHPIIISSNKFYIVDFYFADSRVALEIDGEYHLEKEQITRDRSRTKDLNSSGIKVIRFSNQEVMDEKKFLKGLKEKLT